MENLPLVTVNILSFNRRDELRNTLTKVYEQDYKNIEVIVVDNASSDGSAEMVEKEFPEVILLKLEKNIGIAGWNEGFKIAKGEYVLVLDDDSYPDYPAVRLAVKELGSSPAAAAIAFNIIDVNTGAYFWEGTWLPEKGIDVIKWHVFVGCAVLLNYRLLKGNIFFQEKLFLYQHELSAAARIYNSGYNILFNQKIIAYHNCKKQVEYSSYTDKLVFRNNLYFILDFTPYILKPFYALQNLLFYFTRSIKKKWFNDYLHLVRLVFRTESKGEPVSLKYFFALRKLHLFNYSLISKIKLF